MYDVWDISGKCFLTMDKIIYQNVIISGLIYMFNAINDKRINKALLDLSFYLSEQELMVAPVIIIIVYIDKENVERTGSEIENSKKEEMTDRMYECERILNESHAIKENRGRITIITSAGRDKYQLAELACKWIGDIVGKPEMEKPQANNI